MFNPFPMAGASFRFGLSALTLAALLSSPALAQMDPHEGHRGMDGRPGMTTPTGKDPAHAGHAHDLGPAVATYDLRFIDAFGGST